MDLTKLTAFSTVAEELHFGRAAERLHMTASPLSRQVAQLERELGGALFVRQYHHVALTPMGEALVAPVRQILAQVGELPSIAAEARGEDRPLRIAATTWAPTALVIRFAAAVGGNSGEDGEARLEMVEESDDVVPGLLDGHLDLALLHLPTEQAELAVVPWIRYPLAVAVRADDPLAGRDKVALAQLRHRRMVAPAVPTRYSRATQPVTSLLERAGVTRVEYIRGAVGGVEISREVLLRGVATFVPDLPETTVPSLMPPPAFATVPVEDEGFGMGMGLAWCPGRVGSRPGTLRRIEEAVAALGGVPTPAGTP
ncbi:LysR family transcriptional regulator [Streptomyces flaveolus]|uniref:LysR family transcriptional regulator n=1 Tax=Streptomyces flaveolus TaxID=67297 RepID=UPI00381E96A4